MGEWTVVACVLGVSKLACLTVYWHSMLARDRIRARSITRALRSIHHGTFIVDRRADGAIVVIGSTGGHDTSRVKEVE